MSDKARFRCGAARADITPPLGISLVGSATEHRAEGIHDRLFVHALVLDDGHIQVALVSCDLLFLGAKEVSAIRTLAREKTGIAERNILIAATHTHNGPSTGDNDFIGVASIDTLYVNSLIKKVAEVIQSAKANLQEAEVKIGMGKEDSIAFNRRLKKPDGKVFNNWHCSKEDFLKMGVRPAGPIDPEVGVMQFGSPGGKQIALIVNYACHNTVAGGTKISAEWAGFARERIKQAMGDEMVILFLPGACGNVNNIDYTNLKQKSGYEESERVGAVLAKEILRIIPRMETLSHTDLKIANSHIHIPERDVLPDHIKWARRVLEDEGKDIGETQFAREIMFLSKRRPQKIPVEINCLVIGDAVLIANPAELFVEFGLEIKIKSPFRYTFVAELINGNVGYIPTKEAFEEGGYEPRRTVNTSKLIPEAGEMIIHESLSLMKGKITK